MQKGLQSHDGSTRFTEDNSTYPAGNPCIILNFIRRPWFNSIIKYIGFMSILDKDSIGDLLRFHRLIVFFQKNNYCFIVMIVVIVKIV